MARPLSIDLRERAVAAVLKADYRGIGWRPDLASLPAQ